MIEFATYLAILYVYPLILSLVGYSLLRPHVGDRLVLFVTLFTVFYVVGSLALVNWEAFRSSPKEEIMLLGLIFITSVIGFMIVKRTLVGVVNFDFDIPLIGIVSIVVGYALMSIRQSAFQLPGVKLSGNITKWNETQLVTQVP